MQQNSNISELNNTVATVLEQISSFYSQNKKSANSLLFIIGAIVLLKLTFSILNDINQIPLFAPIFESVGIGCTSWFGYRYLLNVSKREELWVMIENIKSKYIG